MWWGWLKIKKKQKNSVLQYGHAVRKDCFVTFTTSGFSYVILCPSLMMVQTSKGKAPHTCKELIRRIMKTKYEKLLLLKSPQSKVPAYIVISGRKAKQVRDIIHARNIWTSSQMRCSTGKNYFLYVDDNDTRKYILMSVLNVLFLEFILCIVLVLSKILQLILFSHYYLLQNALICLLWPLNSKSVEIHIKCYFIKPHFFQNTLYIACDVFPKVMVIFLHHIKHVSLGFNIYQ